MRGLYHTWDIGRDASIEDLKEFTRKTADKPLYIVASGGSASVAILAAQAHELITGHMAKWITPFEFIQPNRKYEHCNVLLISASGNNTEILESYDHALEALSSTAIIGIMCTSTDNKLIDRVNKTPTNQQNIIVQSLDNDPIITNGGFLATNTTFCMCLWLLRTHNIHTPTFYQLFRTTDVLRREVYKGLKDFNKVKTVIILYDRYTKMVAVDIETKLVESGLVNVQLADYRNFAHGRWNFIDKNKHVGIIALNTYETMKLASDTLSFLPKSTPVYNMFIKAPGLHGGSALLAKSFFITDFFGKIRNVDPAKPKIPDFGRKIHHMKWLVKQHKPSPECKMDYSEYIEKYKSI